MQRSLVGLLVLALVACIGCDLGPVGDPGASPPTAQKSGSGQADDYPHLKMGNPSKARNDPKDKDNYLMKKEFFALSYHDSKGTPNWVSWRLDKEDLGNAPRVPFFPDQTLPHGFNLITPKDYTGSGFDRGHMCPHGDRASSAEASTSTFVMTNLIPQAPDVNQGAWNDLEDYCRHLTTKESHRLYIICGPAGKGGVGKNGHAHVIADGQVTVPATCWKVVMVLAEGGDRDDVEKVFARTRLIAIIMPNDDSVKHDWSHYRTSVKKVEELTGYTFFDKVPAAVINPLKDKVDEVIVHDKHTDR
jgi:endonuclease G, mitochondrial